MLRIMSDMEVALQTHIDRSLADFEYLSTEYELISDDDDRILVSDDGLDVACKLMTTEERQICWVGHAHVLIVNFLVLWINKILQASTLTSEQRKTVQGFKTNLHKCRFFYEYFKKFCDKKIKPKADSNSRINLSEAEIQEFKNNISNLSNVYLTMMGRIKKHVGAIINSRNVLTWGLSQLRRIPIPTAWMPDVNIMNIFEYLRLSSDDTPAVAGGRNAIAKPALLPQEKQDKEVEKFNKTLGKLSADINALNVRPDDTIDDVAGQLFGFCVEIEKAYTELSNKGIDDTKLRELRKAYKAEYDSKCAEVVHALTERLNEIVKSSYDDRFFTYIKGTTYENLFQACERLRNSGV